MANALPDQAASIHGAPSYWLRNERVELYITASGGHMAPVNFRLKHRWVCPYSLAPWTPDEVDPALDPALRVLRGDFFCLPFGTPARNRRVHGEPANTRWELIERNPRALVLQCRTQEPAGSIEKRITLEDGHRAVYQEHRVSGVQGRYPVGVHPTLQIPEGETACLSTAPFSHGQVAEDFADPAKGEYSSLKPGATFETLDSVPLANGGTTSLHPYPARDGFVDLVMLSADPPAPFGWSAVTFPGYVWLSLKDAGQFPSTLFWLSNGGRHGEPWRGRHRRRIGVEEVCSWFASGTAASRRAKHPAHVVTTCRFTRARTESFRTLAVVHPVPRDFGRVMRVEPDTHGHEVVVYGENRATVNVPVNWPFVTPAQAASR